jgi:hypothetical protein
MLLPTASRPVGFGVRHPSGAHNQIRITVRQLLTFLASLRHVPLVSYFFTKSWMQRFDGGFRPPNCSTNLLWQLLMELVNPIGLHNEHSLFQRISIHLYYDVKASKHLASLLTTDWQRERQALDYLYLTLSFRVANFLFANSQNAQPHFITGMICKFIVLLFFL